MAAAFSKSTRTKVFISYSHKDRSSLERLHKHLAPYERMGIVDTWDDTKILPGAIWHEEIERAVKSAKVAILLISADFLASGFIIENELPPLLAAAQGGGALILPVIVSPCEFETSSLAQFQAVNNPSRPLTRMNRDEKEETWRKVARIVSGAMLASYKDVDMTKLSSEVNITLNSVQPIERSISTRQIRSIPYSILNPVSDPKMFYGYHPELERILEGVTSPYWDRRSFYVEGGHRMGKTSLLIQAKQRLRSLGSGQLINQHQQIIIPLYIDVPRLDDVVYVSFYKEISRLLSRHLIGTQVPFEVPSQIIATLQSVTTSTDPLDVLEDSLIMLINAAYPHQLRIVLLIDGLDSIKDKRPYWSIKGNLRALHLEDYVESDAINIPPIGPILAYVITEIPDEKKFLSSVSPLENKLFGIHLHVFDEEQSLALINEPTGGQIPPEVAQQIYKETGGHPFLLQYLMSVLCECDNLAELKVEDVLQACKRFHKERRDFEIWWDELTVADRKVYAVFCENRQASLDDLARMMLSVPSESSDRQQTILKKREIDGSLRNLCATGFIRDSSEDIFEYELAGEWPARWFRQFSADSC